MVLSPLWGLGFPEGKYNDHFPQGRFVCQQSSLCKLGQALEVCLESCSQFPGFHRREVTLGALGTCRASQKENPVGDASALRIPGCAQQSGQRPFFKNLISWLQLTLGLMKRHLVFLHPMHHGWGWGQRSKQPAHPTSVSD